MDSKPPNKPAGLRDVAISRRGGVRTRGGRLPPISMRDIAQVTGTGAKKVVKPNIPQRRAVKKEVEQGSTQSTFLKKEPKEEDTRQKRTRPAKVFLQTGGTFLAEGPAARIKKESPAVDVSYSVPRVSKRELKASESLMKYDLEAIQDVLDSYEANQFYEDESTSMNPYRLPLMKKKVTSEIQIKKEPEDDDDSTEVKIKKEIEDDSPKIKDESIDEKSPLQCFQDVKSSGMLILLKLPNPWLFDKQKDEADSKTEVQEIQQGGCIGTLRFMRSGRMKMVLGSHELELSDRIQSESYMEAAFIESRGGKEGDIVVVDKIDRIMALSPILENLMLESEKPSPACEDK